MRLINGNETVDWTLYRSKYRGLQVAAQVLTGRQAVEEEGKLKMCTVPGCVIFFYTCIIFISYNKSSMIFGGNMFFLIIVLLGTF